jgi:hypothetical protein
VRLALLRLCFVGDAPSSCPNPILVFSLDDDSKNENTPPCSHLPLVGLDEHEPVLAPLLPIWFHTTKEVDDDIC